MFFFNVAAAFFVLMKYILLAAIVVSLTSCEKEKENSPSHTPMTYTDLSGSVINITTPAGIDISGDGVSDAWFEIWHTREDAQNRDVHRFTVSSGEKSKLLVNPEDATPIITEGTIIKNTANAGYEWEAPASIELAKRILVSNTAAPTWEGAWKDVQRKFLAVQVNQNGGIYNGWIELSFDKAVEKIILYRSAISKEAGKEVMAGQ